MRILALAGALALAGCGPATDDDTIRLDRFIVEVAARECAWEFRCCTDAEIKAREDRRFSDEHGCVPYRALGLQAQLYTARLAARQRRLRLDEQKAQACLAMLDARACNPRPGRAAPLSPPASDACVDFFDGATPAGEACIFAGECADGARCVMDARVRGTGVCVPYQRQGEVCNAGADCDPGLRCDPATSTCQPPPDGGVPSSPPAAASAGCVGRTPL